jgi:hypothetical protein
MAIEWCQNCSQLFDAEPGDFYCSSDCRAYGHAVLAPRAASPRTQGRRKPTFSVSAGWAEVAALDAANCAPASTARSRPTSGRSWR